MDEYENPLSVTPLTDSKWDDYTKQDAYASVSKAYGPMDDPNGDYYPSGPICKVVWVISGKSYEKEYSFREHAMQKQRSLLLQKIPAIVKAC